MSRDAIRQKFSNHLVHQDNAGKTYINEQELLYGPNKITPSDLNDLIELMKPPVTVDYIVPVAKEKSMLSKAFSFKLPIQQALAFWTLLGASLFYVAPKDKVVVPSMYGFFAWFAIEQLYHRAGHLTVGNNVLVNYIMKPEAQMRFIYSLHWKHHLEPDRPGNTVSPILKNLVLAAVIFLSFQLIQLPNPLLAMAVLTVQFTFYEFTHWLSHTSKANNVAKLPLVGSLLADIVGHHRAHHKLGERFAVSSGSFWGQLQRRVSHSWRESAAPTAELMQAK